MIEVVCICKWRFKVQDEHAGLSIKCPKCRRLVDVPIAPPALVVETDLAAAPGEAKQGQVEGPAHAGIMAETDLKALQASIERLVTVNQSMNMRLAWIVGLMVLILLRILLRG
ncbi:hypothetical protein V5E97_00190 [Singulisphaera sp. Ch08]|uniref:Zinc finger/thioredoxin putative domain-containing protein n=1 Tax=Singulisphaera sp. Ch08 TaxID=3120278 RepID=A0AAU7CH50_9BACT